MHGRPLSLSPNLRPRLAAAQVTTHDSRQCGVSETTAVHHNEGRHVSDTLHWLFTDPTVLPSPTQCARRRCLRGQAQLHRPPPSWCGQTGDRGRHLVIGCGSAGTSSAEAPGAPRRCTHTWCGRRLAHTRHRLCSTHCTVRSMCVSKLAGSLHCHGQPSPLPLQSIPGETLASCGALGCACITNAPASSRVPSPIDDATRHTTGTVPEAQLATARACTQLLAVRAKGHRQYVRAAAGRCGVCEWLSLEGR